MPERALLIIDIQNDYFPGGKMELEGADAAAANASGALSRFRKEGGTVFHVRHLSTRPGATFFLPGTSGAEIHPAVRPQGATRVFDLSGRGPGRPGAPSDPASPSTGRTRTARGHGRAPEGPGPGSSDAVSQRRA